MVVRWVRGLILFLSVVSPSFALDGLSTQTGMTGLEGNQVVQRQAFILWVDFIEDGSVEKKSAADFNPEGFYTQFLGSEMRRVLQTSQRVHRYRWKMLPTAAGMFELSPPEIRIERRRKKPTGTLVPEKVTVQVEALPLYYPVNLAVSDLQFIAQADLSVVRGKVAQWQLTLTGRGISVESLQAQLAEQLVASDITFFKPTILITPEETRPLDEQINITMPFRPERTDVRLPQLRLASILPTTKQLHHLEIPPVQLDVVSPAWFRVKQVLLWSFGLIAIIGTTWLTWRGVVWARHRREISNVLMQEMSDCARYRALKSLLSNNDARLVRFKYACFSREE